MKKIITSIFMLCYAVLCFSQQQESAKDYQTEKNISYLHPGETDAYKKERCKLDIQYPTNKKDFATLVWFHGGGLEGGEKHVTKRMHTCARY